GMSQMCPKNRLTRCSKQVLFDYLVGSHQYGGGHRSNVEGSASGSPQDVAGTETRYRQKAVPLTGKGSHVRFWTNSTFHASRRCVADSIPRRFPACPHLVATAAPAA